MCVELETTVRTENFGAAATSSEFEIGCVAPVFAIDHAAEEIGISAV